MKKKEKRSNQLSVVRIVDYIINISENMSMSNLKFMGSSVIKISKDSEETISNQDTDGIEEHIVYVNHAKRTVNYERDH